jgi:hypothetical protein
MNVSPLLSPLSKADHPLRSSRNQAYDSGESRRSPRDRSPGRYNDSRESDQYRDRGGPMRSGERRRSIPDARSNHGAFVSNRDNFRESIGRDSRDFPSREPPRGPKELIDAPTGPRASNYGPNFRADFRGGRGRGRGGRGGWRDDSRERGRDTDRDFIRDRDRRDDRPPPPFRDSERGRDRDRWDRDGRESFRGRRPSPQGRGRSPNYGPRDGPRDSRDGPLNLELDRARRGSRDGPLSAGSPSSDSLQPFGRGFSRGRGGRGGRGRGGYYNEDFHRPQPVRSRSPEPNWARRTQPSATPPPQVPAFGSTSTPTGPGSLPPSVPTAPRSHGPKPAPNIGRNVNTIKSYKWTKPAENDPAETRAQDANQPESPKSVGRVSQIASGQPNIFIQSAVSPRESILSRDDVSTGERASPKESIPSIQNPPEKDPASSKPDDAEKDVSQTTVEPPVQQAPSTQARKEPRKRHAVVAKHRAKIQSPALYMSDEDEDSQDELDDNYFEEEIAAIQEQISQAKEQNPLDPSSELDVIDTTIVKPFMVTIDDIVASNPILPTEPCTAPIAEHKAPPQPPALAPEPAIKRRSPPTTPLTEAKPHSNSQINGKNTISQLEAQASARVDTSIGAFSAQPTASIVAPKSSGAVNENPDTRLQASKTRTSPQPKGPATATTNGRSGRAKPLMERFDENEDEQSALEREEATSFAQSRADGLTSQPAVMGAPAGKPNPMIDQSNGSDQSPRSREEESQATRPSKPLANVSASRQNATMDQPVESEDERIAREREEELEAIRWRAIRSVKPVPSGRAAMYKGGLDQIELGGVDPAKHTQQELQAVRKMMKTPPISSLPKFDCGSCWDNKDFLASLEVRDPVVEEGIRKHLREQDAKRRAEQQEEARQWAQRYRNYREWTNFSMDLAAVRSREAFTESRARAAAEAAAPPASVSSASSKPEGRRTGRFATERDFERVLRESEQEAREKKEQDERAARAKTASTKEAIIPDMCWDTEEWQVKIFKDKTHAVSFERSFAALEYGEPIDNFTEEEAATFERVFLESPKQFDKIAAALPNRDFKACIQHYYLVKHSLKLKEKSKEREKKKNRRRGPAKGSKPKANALTASLNVDDTEEGQENENSGDRRRPRRAAAPVFPIDAPVSESDVASPAPTPGRKTATTPKTDTGNEAGPRKKVKIAPQKMGKQAKNSQPIAAAPISAASRQAESPAPPPVPADWKNRKEPAGTSRFPPQLDGVSQGPAATFAPPFADRQGPSMGQSFEAMHQAPPYPTQERVDSTTPIGFEDRRNIPLQTSSYWSVPEQNDFPALLRHFGTDWQGIAKHMTSKTHIMVYKDLFHKWLLVSEDSNKSRRVANVLAQVKNYYQRQVDSGKMKEWEDIAKNADAKRERGEPTGPLPSATGLLKKGRYESPLGSVPRSGSAMEGLEDMSSPGPNAGMTQASPPQPTLSARFSQLAQAGPVPHIQPTTPASVLSKPLPHAPQQVPQAQQQGRQRGPQLGYFTTDSPRPILKAQQNDPTISQRSRQAAEEAQIERQSALRLEQEQREQREQLQLERQRTEALQRERQVQHKQENETTNLHQFEAYSTPPVHSNVTAQSRPEAPQSAPPTEVRRSTVTPQQYQPRVPHQGVRSLLGDITNGHREMKPSPSPSHGPSHAPPMPMPRAPLSAPPANKEQYSAPPQPKPQVPQVAAARQQETVRKTSNIMSLLNDEPSDPRPEPTKRVANVSAPQATSQTPPPPQAQHPLQTNQFTAHASQPPTQPPQHVQQISQQAPQQHASQGQHSYAQPSQHAVHQHSSIGHPRSYTPNSFESRGYGAGPSMPPQTMYSQPARQSMAPQPSAIRREPSLGESAHGLAGGYSRTGPSQSSMRLKESPYSSTPPPAPAQGGRQQIASPLDLAPPGDRDYYSRPSQYLMQQQPSAAGSPQLGPTYHSQSQQPQPSHRQLAFGQGQSHIASPPSHFASQHPLHRSRNNSFDGRFPSTGSAGSTPSHPGYAQPPHQPGPPALQYGQPHPGQERYGSSYDRDMRERRMQEERRIQDEAYQR